MHQIRERGHRRWVLMEVCGGQTHTIVKQGLGELLGDAVEMIHGPGCPVCVTPLEQIDKALALAARPDVIFTSFGDMLRVPGSDCDLQQVRARGGAVRVVYSPLDALALAQANPESEVVFFAVGFETTAPANAMAVWRARELGVQNFSVLVSHVTVPPAMRAILDAPDNRVQAFLAAGHVCTVMGWTEYEPIAAEYHVPIVVTGFEPIDILEGIHLAVRQLEAGRHEVENQYVRAVTRDGTVPARNTGGAGVPAGRPEVARHRGDSRQRTGAARRVRGVRCGTEVRPRRHYRGGAGRVSRRRRAARPAQAAPVSGVRRPLHTGASARRPNGVVGRRVCGVLQLRAVPCRRTAVRDQHDRDPGRERRGVSRSASLQADRVQLGHGSGGKLSAALLRERFLPHLGNPILDQLGDAAVLALPTGEIAISTDTFVVRPLEFPGGNIGALAVHGTVNDLAMMGAEPRYLTLGVVLEEGLPFEVLDRILATMAAAAAEAGVTIVTGDTKVVERGKADGMYINTTGVGLLHPVVRPAAHRAAPGDAVLVSGMLGRHGMAVMALREGLEFDTTITSDTASLWPLVRATARCARGRPARAPGSDARRAGERAQRDRRGVGHGDRARRGGAADPGRRRRRLRDAGPRSALRGQRGRARGHRAGGPGRCRPRGTPGPSARRFEPADRRSSVTASRNGRAAHRTGGHAGGGPPSGRPAPANLLIPERRDA